MIGTPIPTLIIEFQNFQGEGIMYPSEMRPFNSPLRVGAIHLTAKPAVSVLMSIMYQYSFVLKGINRE